MFQTCIELIYLVLLLIYFWIMKLAELMARTSQKGIRQWPCAMWKHIIFWSIFSFDFRVKHEKLLPKIPKLSWKLGFNCRSSHVVPMGLAFSTPFKAVVEILISHINYCVIVLRLSRGQNNSKAVASKVLVAGAFTFTENKQNQNQESL